MKKFKNAKQLKEEKNRLKMRRAELEKAIRYDWRDVKTSLTPKNIAGQVMAGLRSKTEPENRPGSGILSGMALRFASRLASKAEDRLMGKFGKWFKK